MDNIYRSQSIEDLKRHFGSDQRRINHALNVLANAETIMDGEKTDEKTRRIVTITALLHDVGIKAAEEKYNSSAGPYQELEGPPIVTAILTGRGEPQAVIQRIAYIVGGHHTAAKNDGLDFQIIWEADLLVNIEEEGLTAHPEKLRTLIAKNFRTVTGSRLAQERYLH